MSVVWANAVLLFGGTIATAIPAYIFTKGTAKIVEKAKKRYYEKRAEEAEKINSVLKFSSIPKREHEGILKTERMENEFLKKSVEHIQKNSKAINERLYDLNRENSFLKKEYEEKARLEKFENDYAEALKEIKKLNIILKTKHTDEEIRILTELATALPYTINREDMKITGLAEQEIKIACKSLERKKIIQRIQLNGNAEWILLTRD